MLVLNLSRAWASAGLASAAALTQKEGYRSLREAPHLPPAREPA